MGDDALEIRTLRTADEMAPIVTVFQQVWGAVTPLVGVELLCAIQHAGGYVAAAFDSGNIIGASFGFLGRHCGAPALHSHVTGILPGVQHAGVGRAMKFHQRDWAAASGLDWVTWTFDPLVRRNAWFNLEVLRAEVSEYLVDFYGPLRDSVNAGDESDRLVVAWATRGPLEDERAEPLTVPDGAVEVPTPDDIVVLRRTDPSAAVEWRHRVREDLGDRIRNGGRVLGFTRAGCYVVEGAA